jgi:multidrug resistance efflux pump
LGLEIYPQVSGTIIEIKPVKTQVEKGDVIVRLDDRQSKLELQYLRTLQSIKQQDFDKVDNGNNIASQTNDLKRIVFSC